MRFHEVIARLDEAIAPPVTYDQVVTPEWIEEVLDYGFDVGKPHPRASTDFEDGYDWESMYRMLVELQNDGIIPKDVDINNDQQKARQYIEEWFKDRYRYVLEWMSAEQVGGSYVVHRAITLPSERSAVLLASGRTRLGEFWSFSGGRAFWGNDEHSECHMKALVASNAIDWITTMRRNMNYVFGEEEMEVFLPKGTPVRLVAMTFAGKAIAIRNPERQT